MEEKINTPTQKMKVCFFSPASYPFFFTESEVAHGGAELQMFLWAKSIAEHNDFDICFLLENHNKTKFIENYNIQLIKTIQLKKKDVFFYKILKSIKYFFQLIKLKPNVLICTNASALVGINAFYSKLFHKKLIYRTSSEIDLNKEYILQNGFSGKLYKYGLTKAAQIITQNHEHKKLLNKNHNIDAVVVKNFFEIKEQNITDKKYILWVSRFAEMKNPDLFLKLAILFTDEEFVMICPYDISQKENWEKLKSRTDEIDNLTFIKKVPFYEIQKYFNKALLFVNTSDFEGFPNTFLQAAQGKTPVVSLNVNPDNFITEYDCGSFADGSFEKMVLGIKNLLKNNNERTKKAENLFRYLKENHDFKKNGQKLNNIIERIL